MQSEIIHPVRVVHGDARTLPMADSSVDAIVCDPPYGLEFMGKEWDSFKPSAARLRTRLDGRTNPTEGKSTTTTPEAYVAGAPFQRWCEQWAREAYRVLKPGGHMLAFGGSRTWHRLACAIEDAGFELRDSIAWMYGSGFPKSRNVSKDIDVAAGAERKAIGPPPYSRGRASQSYTETRRVSYDYDPLPVTAPATDDARRWQGWGTALKPGFEPIVVARKPLIGTVAQNVLAYGTGALNIDACRVAATARPLRVAHGEDTTGKTTYGSNGPGGGSHAAGLTDTGRWPTNVVLSHAPLLDADCDIIGDACADGCVPGCPVADLDAQSGATSTTGRRSERSRSAAVEGTTWGVNNHRSREYPGETGGASRFFPVFRYQAKAPTRERPKVDGVAHPTVKPLGLMRWLVRLVTPADGVVLDMFAGSGATVEAALLEEFAVIGVEKAAEHLPLIRFRVERVQEQLAANAAAEAEAAPALFDLPA